MKYIHTFESFVTEGISQEAYSIHSVTQCGQDAAQNFIDDNNIDAKKLADYVKQHSRSKEKYDVRDMIKDPKSNSMLLKQFIKESVVNEDFPGPGETVLAKDITPSVLDYFDRTNKKLLIDTKTKKGITGEVGRMYNDLVFNGDTIQLKDIIQVKILESTNDAVNEDQHFLNFRYATGMDKIQIDSIENYRKEQKPTTEFEKAAKPFGSLPGVFVFTPQTPKEVETIKLLATKHSVFGIWAVNNKGAEVFITRAS